MNEKKQRILITGGSGYVGAMLADQFARQEAVEALFLVDKESFPEFLNEHPNKEKFFYLQANLADNTWQEKARDFGPDTVIHTAWQIREMYGKKDIQWRWNVGGSDNVFDFAFSVPDLKKLIHFSTVASYASYPDNRIDHFFTEEEGFRKSDYLYAEEKRIVEEHLKGKYDRRRSDGGAPQVFVLRPAAITGPRGRYMRVRFGLQAALSGQLKKGFIHRLISTLVSVVPVTPKWLRQFIHEDDVNNIVSMLSLTPVKGEYEAFNICPPGDVVLGKDMAEAVGKKMITIQPWMVRIAFFLFWHTSRGRVPTSKGGWKSYSYPIAVDGSKLTRRTGYVYNFKSKEAFVKKEGRYAKYITSPSI